MKRNMVAALIAGIAAIILMVALSVGPWLLVAIPSAVAGLVYRSVA